MLLVMDIGNTNIKIGLYDKEKLIASWRVQSNPNSTSDEYGAVLRTLFAQGNLKTQDVVGVMVSSVMPSLNYTIEHMCKHFFNCKPMFVANGIKTGLNIKYDNIASLGADRIVNCVAASKLYKAPVIVVDFGTATTFSVVDKTNTFIGGAICPGMKMSADALFKAAANLPKIELGHVDGVIQKSTVKNMRAGILYGFAGMVEYMLRRMKKELNEPNAKVVATGGMSELVANEIEGIDSIDRTLTLTGLLNIYQLNQK